MGPRALCSTSEPGDAAVILLLSLACLLTARPNPAAGAPESAEAVVVPRVAPARSRATAGAPTQATPVEISVDPRVELLAVVQSLAGYDQLGTGDLDYRREVLTRFAPWRAHPAVTLFARMAREGFSRDAPPAVMLRLAEPPALELRAPFSVYVETRAGGRERLFAFLDSLRDFAAESRFMEFYAAHERHFRRLVGDARRVLRRTRVVGPLEEYFGVREHGYHLILAPLLHAGGYAAEVERPPGIVDCYAILGPSRASHGRPRFWDPDALEALLWHEFSHVFVGNLPESCRREIAADSALFEPLRARMLPQGYARWEVCADEHLVRAVGVRLVARMEGAHAAEKALDLQLRLGFAYLPRLLVALERFERERALFPTLGDFCPALADAIRHPGAPHIEKP
jgi:hypothetical protein